MLAAPAFAGERLVAHKLNSEGGLPDNNIRYIGQDSLGRLRLLSVYALYQYDGYSFHKLPQAEFQKARLQARNNRNGRGFTYDNLGNKVLTEEGDDIVYIDSKTGERIRLQVFSERLRRLNPSLKCMVVTDQRGLIWVSVNGNGLFVYDRRTGLLDHITKKDERRLIDSDQIIYMMEDRDGNIWVSQELYGVVCLMVEHTSYNVLDISREKTVERENEVRLMRRLADGSIILCNSRGKLMRTDGNLNGLTDLNGLMMQLGEDDNYNSVELDGRGRLWLGSQKRGVRIGGQWYGSARVDCILKDGKDRMWTCSLDGDVALAQLDDEGNYTERHFLTDIQGLRPRTMIQDYQGTVWVGADGGLFAFDPDQLLKDPQAYRQVSNVPSRSLLEDSSHRLWIGTTQQGLGRLNADGTLSFVTRDDGLPNDVVQAVAENTRHQICIATENGCARYDPKTGAVVSLYFPDNRIRNFYNADCAMPLDDGRMAFGSLDGIVIVDKDPDIQLKQHLKSVVTDLLINGVSVLDMGEDSPVEGDVSQVKDIRLDADQNSLIIRFSNFDYSRSHLAGYVYKLDGYDREWSMMSNQNEASYKNLKPGSYTLTVKYRDERGWGPEERVLHVTISPPWWATWWARLLFLLTGLVIGYVIYRQIRAVGRLHQRIAVEQQMTDYKLRFFTNISHEFRTPLTLIQGAMEKIRQVGEVPGSIKQPLSNMQKSTDRMLRLINQLLEFRRIQNDKLTLTLVETDIVQFVNDIYIGFHETADNRHITYTFTPFKKSFMMYIDRGHVDKIVYNLLSNAFKYTPERESISVNIRQNEDRIVVSVTDTGIGVAKEKQGELFDRFSTGRVSGDSIGIGLNLSQELAHAHHGEVTYQENVPKGSIFTLVLPTDKSIYQETDFMVTQTGLQEDKPKERKGFTDSYREVKALPLNSRRVLVAEDNMELGMMIKDELGTYFEVDVVGNGMEALEQLKATAESGNDLVYDLLVSDVMMPIMNGFELTRRIRADKALSGLPVILLTALTGEEDTQKGLEAGADAYIEKPFSPSILTTQAINLIEQRDRLKVTYAQQPQKPAVKELMRNDADKKFLLQLDAFIEKHMGDYNLSVDVIAAHFEYGRTRFYNKVRAITGMTPNDYLKEKRLTRAAELLRESTAITVAEVAYRVGINNTRYFAVSFKKAFGVTPSGYQRGEQPEQPE